MQAAGFISRRSQALVEAVRRVVRQLARLIRGYRSGIIALPTAVDEAVAALAEGYREALESGSAAAMSDHGVPGLDVIEELIEHESEFQRDYVLDLFRDMHDLSDAQLDARLDIYGETLTRAYNQGYGDAVDQVHPDWEWTWHLGHTEHCDLCVMRDGQTYDYDDLPGWPGSSGFGGPVCEGGPRCGCWLEAHPPLPAEKAAIADGDFEHGEAVRDEVYEYLAKYYPEDTLDWVKQAHWRRSNASLKDIDMDRRPGGRDPAKVRGIAAAIADGKKMDRVVLVETSDEKCQIADGYHRTLAFRHAGRRAIPAYIATGAGEHGPWEREMHDRKLNKSAKTPMYSVTHHPLGTEGLWHHEGVQLPPYIQNVAKGLMESGMPRSRAIPTAINALRRWARGEGHVHPEVRAASRKALAEWDALKARY